jgi:hypothetical protein
MNKKPDNAIKSELCHVKSWAQGKIQEGSQPPWAWYQYMKLVESIDAILISMQATKTENLPQSAEREEKLLRLVGAKCRPNTAQRRHDKIPVRMPM